MTALHYALAATPLILAIVCGFIATVRLVRDADQQRPPGAVTR